MYIGGNAMCIVYIRERLLHVCSYIVERLEMRTGEYLDVSVLPVETADLR